MRGLLRFLSVMMQIWAGFCVLGLVVMVVNYDEIKGSKLLAFTCTPVMLLGLWFGGRWLWARTYR